jgi:hypothetical protein
MAGCTTLTKGIQASCAATKKVGGIDKRVYLGNVNDLDGVTVVANEVTVLTFAATKGLTQWIGRKDKNNSGSELEVGENLNIRNHSVNLIIYYETALQLGYLDDLIDNEGIFAIVETNAGVLEIFGLNKTSWDNFGMKVTANVGSSGTVMQDSTAFACTLSGGHTNLQLIYKGVDGVLETSLAALDALCIDPAP